MANGDATGFDPPLRLRVLPPDGGWFILDDAFVLGAEAEDEKQRYRSESGWKRQVKGKRKKPEDRLRLKDPWRVLSRVEKDSSVIQWLLVLARAVVRRLLSSFPFSGLVPSPILSLHGAFGLPGFSTFFFLCFTLSPSLWWTGKASIATVVLGIGVGNLGQVAGALVGKSSVLSCHQNSHPRKVRINPRAGSSSNVGPRLSLIKPFTLSAYQISVGGSVGGFLHAELSSTGSSELRAEVTSQT